MVQCRQFCACRRAPRIPSWTGKREGVTSAYSIVTTSDTGKTVGTVPLPNFQPTGVGEAKLIGLEIGFAFCFGFVMDWQLGSIQRAPQSVHTFPYRRSGFFNVWKLRIDLRGAGAAGPDAMIVSQPFPVNHDVTEISPLMTQRDNIRKKSGIDNISDAAMVLYKRLDSKGIIIVCVG